MIFPVVRYGCKSWTIKKAEHQRIDAFELWSWRRLLKVPWTAGRSNLKEINPKYSLKYSLEGLMLKLKLQYFGHLMRLTHLERPWCWKDWSQEKTGTTEDDGWMASLTQWTWVWVASGSWWWTGRPGVLQSMGSQGQTWLSAWATGVPGACLFSPAWITLLSQLSDSTLRNFSLWVWFDQLL